MVAGLRRNPLLRLERRELVVGESRVRVFQLSTSDPALTEARGLPTFALVHGLGVSSKYFVPLAEELAPFGRVVLFDLPGFAGLPEPPTRPTIGAFARVVTEALVRLDADDPVLVGHSLGAQVVAEILVTRPGYCPGAMLIGPVVNAAERNLPLLTWRFAQSAARESPANAAVAATAYLRAGPRWFRDTVPQMLRYPIERRLSGTPTPLVLVRGTHDRVAPPDWLEDLAARARVGRVVTVPSAAHGVVFDHGPLLAREVLTLVPAIPGRA